MRAVNTAHSGSCKCRYWAIAKESTAATVTRSAKPACTRRRRCQARTSRQVFVARFTPKPPSNVDDAHQLRILIVPNSKRQQPDRMISSAQRQRGGSSRVIDGVVLTFA